MPLHLTNDVCRQIQCFAYTGEVSAQDMEDCQSRGFWPPLTCADERCKPYPQCTHSGELFLVPNPSTNLLMPTMPQIVEDAPINPASLQSVMPSVSPSTENQEPGPLCPSAGARYNYTDPVCKMGQWLTDNPVMGLVLVAGVFLLAKK